MEGKENTTPALELRHISKSFPGVKALSDVSFAVEKGREVHVLVGENGAGKSTLIKIINGIYSADEGEIFMFGEKDHACFTETDERKRHSDDPPGVESGKRSDDSRKYFPRT